MIIDVQHILSELNGRARGQKVILRQNTYALKSVQ